MGRKKQAERQSGKGARGGAKGVPGGLEPKRRCTPDERRAAVEAYEKSGLTQGAFACGAGTGAGMAQSLTSGLPFRSVHCEPAWRPRAPGYD